MEQLDPAFLAEMARELDATMRKLESRVAELVMRLGSERVEELRALWAKELDANDEEDIKRHMDWEDKELIWVWVRLGRARQKRVLVGRHSMLATRPGREPAIDPEKPEAPIPKK